MIIIKSLADHALPPGIGPFKAPARCILEHRGQPGAAARAAGKARRQWLSQPVNPPTAPGPVYERLNNASKVERPSAVSAQVRA